MGWRYFVFTLGSVMLLFSLGRLFAFPMLESPRYLLGRGQDAEAVAVVREIARYNGAETALTSEDLEEAARGAEEKQGAHKWRALSEGSPWTRNHVRQLFATKRMALSTTLLIWIWGMLLFLDSPGPDLVIAAGQVSLDSRQRCTITSYHTCQRDHTFRASDVH